MEVIGKDVRAMFGTIANRYDITNTVLSFGQHWLWRLYLRRAWRDIPRDARVLDLCTGTGDVYRDLVSRFPNTIGADFCLPMLVSGEKKFRPNGKETLGALQADALKTPFHTDSFDLIVVSFGIRNLESLSKGLAECRRILREGGKLLILEFGQPSNPLWRFLFEFYSKYLMPVIGGIFTGNRDAYEYLPETSKSFPCGEEFSNILSESGFIADDWKPLSGGIAYLYSAQKI